MPLNIVVLVSIGRHPVSGRERRAEDDARALGVARSLTDRSHISILHAGVPDASTLNEYLGVGADRVEVLPVPPERDVVPGLAAEIKRRQPDLVLTGSQAEQGDSSGMLPYAVAEHAGLAIAAGITKIETNGDTELRLQQALPGGQRRALAAPRPLLATIDPAAGPVPAFIYMRSRRGNIETLDAPDEMPILDRPESQAARRRPKRIGTSGGNQSAADRLKAAAGAQSAGGQQIETDDPDEAAAAIIEFLEDKAILKR
ncbi:electron transfer flavoprotein subunit beta [Salinisphaera sp. USBA-960]|nr:electron transfer flavoprotein subunit beta [Salifodinibacter halophilus]NNC26906.1 electron transfer flavoprotein subunit beta [Salifodinibacter halophilus]